MGRWTIIVEMPPSHRILTVRSWSEKVIHWDCETKQHNIKLWLASYNTDPLAMAWKDIWNCKQVPLDVHQKKKKICHWAIFLAVFLLANPSSWNWCKVPFCNWNQYMWCQHYHGYSKTAYQSNSWAILTLVKCLYCPTHTFQLLDQVAAWQVQAKSTWRKEHCVDSIRCQTIGMQQVNCIHSSSWCW